MMLYTRLIVFPSVASGAHLISCALRWQVVSYMDAGFESVLTNLLSMLQARRDCDYCQ